jgi:hypothetical protein
MQIATRSTRSTGRHPRGSGTAARVAGRSPQNGLAGTAGREVRALGQRERERAECISNRQFARLEIVPKPLKTKDGRDF